MGLCFARYGTPVERERAAEARRRVEECWERLGSAVDEREVERCRELVRTVDERLDLVRREGLARGDGLARAGGLVDGSLVHADRGPSWFVTYDELPARGVAEWVAGGARGGQASVGLPACPLERVLRDAGELGGCDVSRARVRVGFTRGHAVEVMVALPSATREPQIVAERLVEGLLGEAETDDWVAAVDVIELPRPGSLRVVQPGPSEGESFPLAALPDLVARAREGVRALLPTEPRHRLARAADWTWLEMPPDPEGVQPDRICAATCAPELVKAALEGLPFHSRRFSRWEERFVWIATPASDARHRAERRHVVEERFDETLRAEGLGAVVGTGFGARFDYLDLCLGPEDAALERVLALGAELEFGRGAELGFYDSRWAEERLSFPSRA